jgi:hypothetical protein
MDIMKEKPMKTKKYDVQDMVLFEIGAIAFALLAAKLWEPLLSLPWYGYAGAFVLALAKPFYKMFFV